MLEFSVEQLATFVALPMVTIVICWTIAIFQRNRIDWLAAYDIPIVILLTIAILRNIIIIIYIIMNAIDINNTNLIIYSLTNYCGIIIWLFHSLHTFEASLLATLAIITTYSIRLQRKNQQLNDFLTITHIIYHIGSLMILCACVGVAAILATHNSAIYKSTLCTIMPYELNEKYHIFILILHGFLTIITIISIITFMINYLKQKNQINKQLIYDKTINNNYHRQYNTYIIKDKQRHLWTSTSNNWTDSDLTMTVSSTDSCKPCLEKMADNFFEQNGLETVIPILIVCYAFYHLPLIILCSYPKLVAPWPVAGVALWLGLVQDILIPIGLSLVDSRFALWVTNVYNCTKKCHKNTDKLPHVGLDGKFRPFSIGTNQPTPSLTTTLESTNHDDSNGDLTTRPHHHHHHYHHSHHQQQQQRHFPLTNGSLYTSTNGDGHHLPVIFRNYRRQNHDQSELQQRHLHSDDFMTDSRKMAMMCRNCETDLYPSQSDLHHLIGHNQNSKLNLSTNHYTSSEEEEVDNLEQPTNEDDECLSSAYSITTEANCDFDFYDANERHKLRRTNSYSTLELGRGQHNGRGLIEINSNLTTNQKHQSHQLLTHSNVNNNLIEQQRHLTESSKIKLGSVPDLKKIFISEYI